MNKKIVARYIGENGSMGLHTDELHVITSEIKFGLLKITWETNSCSYSGLEDFLEDWEVTKYIW